jgi:glycosyltransferase involved in cell wall biosynthesis
MEGNPRPLRVAILSSASGGGAGIAASRLYAALNRQEATSADFIDMELLDERLPDDVSPPFSLSNRKSTDTHFTVEYSGFVRGWLIEMLDNYDVLNVHWASYLISSSELDELSKRRKRLVFTLHDYYYLTGGCHYPAGCSEHVSGCLRCPQVDGAACKVIEVAHALKLKRRVLCRANVSVVTPSEFLRRQAIGSGSVSESQAHVVRNAYEPVLSPGVRARSPGRVLLIADSFGERRKGMQLAIESLAEASARLRNGDHGIKITVDLVGAADEIVRDQLRKNGVHHIAHGKVDDHKELARIYSAARFVLTCSSEDNWPNILVEAGSYGCIPIVGPGHGCEEFVRTFGAGKVARLYVADSFGECIVRAVVEKEDTGGISRYVEDVRRTHDPDKIADRYKQIFMSG